MFSSFGSEPGSFRQFHWHCTVCSVHSAVYAELRQQRSHMMWHELALPETPSNVSWCPHSALGPWPSAEEAGCRFAGLCCLQSDTGTIIVLDPQCSQRLHGLKRWFPACDVGKEGGPSIRKLSHWCPYWVSGPSFSSASWPPWSGQLCSTMYPCHDTLLCRRPNVTSQGTMDWNLWKPWPKAYFPQPFCQVAQHTSTIIA